MGNAPAENVISILIVNKKLDCQPSSWSICVKRHIIYIGWLIRRVVLFYFFTRGKGYWIEIPFPRKSRDSLTWVHLWLVLLNLNGDKQNNWHHILLGVQFCIYFCLIKRYICSWLLLFFLFFFYPDENICTKHLIAKFYVDLFIFCLLKYAYISYLFLSSKFYLICKQIDFYFFISSSLRYN